MVFFAEEIIDRRVRIGRVQYYVKWRSSNGRKKITWEKESNLGCTDLIEEFELKHKKKEEAAAAKKVLQETNANGPSGDEAKRGKMDNLE